MFRGANAINIDAKGRMAIPSRYRDRLKDMAEAQMVITVDLTDPCLLLFPLNHWEELERDLDSLSTTNPGHRRIKRLLLGHAKDVEMDANGRVLIPAELREHAGLEKAVMLAGQGKTFQLWDETKWQAKISEDLAILADDSFDAADLPDLSF